MQRIEWELHSTLHHHEVIFFLSCCFGGCAIVERSDPDFSPTSHRAGDWRAPSGDIITVPTNHFKRPEMYKYNILIGASYGIGRSTADIITSGGAHVVYASRSSDKLHSAIKRKEN